VAAAATTRRGVYTARTWAAPRLERAGYALEQRVAPKMATMLSAAARRVDPAPRRRRRWPIVAAGLVTAAGLSATAAYLMNRRGPGYKPAEPIVPPGTAPEPAAETVGSDVNGRVPTS
jgi:hypothetical protein